MTTFRTTTWRWAVAGFVVLAVGAGVAVGATRSRSTSGAGRAARGVVTGYLSALARGDATAALQAGEYPPQVATFVTDGILAKQRAIASITGIDAGAVELHGDNATVSASYRFGSRPITTRFVLDRGHDGRWRMLETTVHLYVGTAHIAEPTLFGRPVRVPVVDVFPGPLELGSAAPDVTVTDRRLHSFPAEPGGTGWFLDVSVDLTRDAKERVLAAVTGSPELARCVRSRQLRPAKCPQWQGDPDGIDGTATWTMTKPRLSIQDIGDDLVVYVGCRATWSVTYQARDGGRRDAESWPIDGHVDLKASPLTFRVID